MARIPDPSIRTIAKSLPTILTTSVLLVPAILVNIAQTTTLRFTIYFIAAALFITALTAASDAIIYEISVAAAVYAAVLIARDGAVGVDSSGNGLAEANWRPSLGLKVVCQSVQGRS